MSKKELTRGQIELIVLQEISKVVGKDPETYCCEIGKDLDLSFFGMDGMDCLELFNNLKEVLNITIEFSDIFEGWVLEKWCEKSPNNIIDSICKLIK